MNNLYYWDSTEFNKVSRVGGMIAFAPDKETAIRNILEWAEKEYSDKYWNLSADALQKKLNAIDQELRSSDPVINPTIINIEYY